MIKKYLKPIVLLVILTMIIGQVNAQRKMENLGRGVVAIRTGTSSAFISWRLLGNDPYGIGFNLYRSKGGAAAVKLNSSTLTGGTNYTDISADLTQDNAYFVKPVLNSSEQTASGSFTLTANHATEPCVTVPLHDGTGYTTHFVWVGDLDGDGEYDFVIDRLPTAANVSQKIEAYKRDGTRLWVVDLGPNSFNTDNISPGSSTIDVGNWDGVTVYDMDGDGKAEVMIRTANGEVFGDGITLTNANNNIQFISVLNGLTGAERARIQLPTDYISTGPLACSLGIGYLNGITPSLVGFMKNRNADGSFNRVMCAWDFDGTNISLKWKSNLTFGDSYGTGSDGHQMRILDFDGDGKDDIGEVGFVVKNDGTLLYNLGDQNVYHGDRWHVGKLDPNRPGLQGYGIQQDNITGLLEYYYDAGTGKVLWKHTSINVGDVGRGETGDIDPTHPGYEVWSFSGLYNGPSNTQLTQSATPYPNFRIWWDGDVLSENMDQTKIEKWNYTTSTLSRLLTGYNYENATYSDRNAPMFYGDIFGDWREEVIFTDNTYSKLVIFTTPIPTDTRLYTLPHNPEYRNCMTIKGYMQSNMLDYYLGAGMTTPPTPPMQTAKCVWKGNLANNIWDAATTANWLVNGVAGNFTQGDDVMFDISGAPDTSVVLSGVLTPSSIKLISPLNYSYGGTGIISGSTGILKSGNGALSLNTSCDYTDTTRVEQGSLYVNNNLTQSTILVGFATTLGGAGTITKTVILKNGAMISPGAKGAVGTLTFAGGLTLPSGSSCLCDITDDATGTTKPSDKIVITGNLTVTDTLTIVVNKINGTVNAGTYPLIAYSGSFTGNIAKIGVSGLFGQKYALSNSGGIISLTIEAARDAAKVIWNGSSDTWDLQTTPAWSLNGSPVTFVPNDSVIFDQNGSNNPSVKVTGSLTVKDIAVDASENNYAFVGAGNIGGPAGLTKTGLGTLSLLTTNTYTGKTLVNAGKLEISSLADAGTNSSIGANTLVASSEFVFNNAYFKYSGTGNASTNKGLTINGISDTIEVANSGSMLTIQGIITGTGSLVKTGPGTLNLQLSSNTYTGNTFVIGGTFALGDQTANSGGVSNGSVTLSNGTLTLYNNSSSNEFYTNLVVPGGSSGYFNEGQRCHSHGTLTGGGTLNVYLPGNIDRTIFFGDWSAFTGIINITGVASSSFRIGNSFGYTGATFNLNTNVAMYHGGTGTSSGDAVAETVNIGALSGTTGSTIKDENWVIGAKNVDATFSGLITGNSITKVGTGAWTLTNANTYTGGTIVNGGSLIVNNTTGSGTGTGAVTVNGTGTLAGTGIISGVVSVTSGGTIAPGTTAIGTIKLGNNLVLSSGGTTLIKIDRTNNMQDSIRITGTVSLNGALNLQLQSGAFAAGNAFKIIKAASYSGTFSSIIPADPGTNLAWDLSTLATDGTIRVILKQSQTITFTVPTNKNYGDAPFSLNATGGASTSPVTFSIVSGDAVTLSGNTVTIINAGSVTIKASQAGDANYLPATDVTQTLNIAQVAQTISFSVPTDKKYGDPAFTLSATGGGSGNPVTFSVASGDVVSLTGNTVTIVKAGSAQIKASQAGNNNYTEAGDVTNSLVISKAQLTVKAADTTRYEKKANPVFNLSYTGFVNNDNTANLDVMPIATCVADTLSATGNYPIVVSGGSDKNYIFTYIDGTLIVEKNPNTGIKAISDHVSIYPNPVTDKLTVNIGKTVKKLILTIETLNGAKMMESTTYSMSTIMIDISDLATGVYILKLNIDGQLVVNKLVKN